MEKVISIDLGTTLIKCSLYEAAGNLLAAESFPCFLEHPYPEYAEQDADVWYWGVCKAIRNLAVHCNPREISSIAISSQGISVVPVDCESRPLCHAISWLDVRAAEECKELLAYMSEDAWFRKTGKFIAPSYTLPKLLWLRRHHTALFEEADKFLLPMDYLNARITGHAVTDHTMAAGTMCYDILANTWCQEIIDRAGIRRDQLAEIRPAGALVGTLNKETAMYTGLSTSVRVINGGQDQKVAAFAADVSSECASLSLGTAGALEIVVSDATGQHLLPVFPAITPDSFLVEGCINTTGAAIQWLKDTLCPDISFDDMNRLAEAAPIGSQRIRFYPHLGKPGTPHRTLSCYGSIHELSLGASRGDLIRSLYEGLAYEIRLNLEYACQAGAALQGLMVFGGASKSRIFCQIIADVTGLPVQAAENGEFGSIGAAKIALQGIGLDGTQFVRCAVGDKRLHLPSHSDVTKYDSLYNEFIKIYKKRG